ncbi:MAG: Hydroxypyruvate isomerase [Betaproteobacteria bacterium]|nr:Hydroxypyruvate isomerase [Betaproteobacteria bacterium]
MKLAANLVFLYPHVDFLDRFALAARDGFKAVEFFFPYPYAASELAQRLADNDLQVAVFNATPRVNPAERGIAALPGREAEFREGFLRALEYAEALRCPCLHTMAGVAPLGIERARLLGIYAENLAWAAEQAAPSGRKLLIEPINPRDSPGFLINRQDQAHALIDQVGSPQVQVMMDLYHCQIVEGDVEMKLRQYIPTGRIGHVQIAGVPQRHEPDTGELNYAHVLRVLDELGYTGWVGAEYHPRRDTSAGLGWLKSLF